jgi:hypothetical protein
MQNVLDRITANPKFLEFVAMRSRYSIIMAIISASAYYGFILLVAFNKEFLATKLGPWNDDKYRCANRCRRYCFHHSPDLDLCPSCQHRIRRNQRIPHQGGTEIR